MPPETGTKRTTGASDDRQGRSPNGFRHDCWSTPTRVIRPGASAPPARAPEGLAQAAETYTPLQAWQVLNRPTIAINANSSMCGQQAGSKPPIAVHHWGTYVDNTGGQGRANVAVTGTVPYAGKQALSGGDEVWIRAEHTDPSRSRSAIGGDTQVGDRL